ncbi:permease-like cell division protein FtsX [Phytohabitans sp. LJ34]|uniref:permease-like cell division protein FtsX n=1 Tax=Phytohabitans sp. LJ34 TaxID=3452217 RepID=UPI003F891AE7
MSDTPAAAVPPPTPADRSAPRPRRVLLAALAVAALLCGAGLASAVTFLVMRDDAGPGPAREHEVRVFLDVDATAEQKAAVESALSSRYPGGTIRVETREQAYQRFKELYKDEPDLVEKVRPDSFPESLLVTTTAKVFDCAGLAAVAEMDGVGSATVWQLAAGERPRAMILDCP